MYVYVVDADDKAVIRDVVPGDWYEQYWVISSGLKEGDEVIVDGVNKVIPGASIVRVKD